MASSMATTRGEMQWGLVGSVHSVPPGFRHSVLLLAGQGLARTWRRWGAALSAKHGTTRREDFTSTYLGYQTDNGAYYYYEPGVADALRGVHEDGLRRGIPYRFAHLDSWWYWKSDQEMGGGGVPLGGGVLNWTAMPSVFPGGNSGISKLHQATGWPLMAHNRWWSNMTQYASKWHFVVEASSTAYPKIGMALPLDRGFWDFLFAEAKSWGLTTYEQDWLWTNYLGTQAALEDATVGRRWLLEMGRAADAHGLSIMYCMALPRMVLQAAEVPAVTQLRVSDDYGLAFHTGEAPQQWRIGRSSLLADALGLKPFKDGFFSDGAAQVGGHASGKKEPFPALQAAVATLSAGAVMPNDGVGRGDPALLRRSCMADGRLLQPSRPAVALDQLLMEEAFAAGPRGLGLSRSEVWATASLPGRVHLLAADLQRPIRVRLEELLADANATTTAHLAYMVPPLGGPPQAVHEVGVSGGLGLVPRRLPDFEVWHLAPVVDGSWALLGELEKWVPTAPQRFVAGGDPHVMTLRGPPGEAVTVWVAERLADGWAARPGTCTLPPSGRVKLLLPSLLCDRRHTRGDVVASASPPSSLWFV